MRHKVVQVQQTRVLKSKTTYWDWTSRHNKKSEFDEPLESTRANPDHLGDNENTLWKANDENTKEVQERVQKLLKLSKQILTQQQYNVFVLMAVKDPALTERETAKALSLSKTRVHTLWNGAREKLKVAYEQRTS